MPIYTSYSGELATKLQDYRAKGQKEGSKHRPASDAAGLDAHESALKVEAEGWLNAQQTLFDSTLTDVSRNVVEARQKAIEFGSQVKMLVSDDTLVSSVDSELAGFRQGIVAQKGRSFFSQPSRDVGRQLMVLQALKQRFRLHERPGTFEWICHCLLLQTPAS